MNLSGPLLLLLLTAACMVSGEEQSNGVWQFGRMIRCVQPDVNPSQYNKYGCYCGLRGRGTPVDEVDLCCKVHDDCYGVQLRNPLCKGYFYHPYVSYYQHTCSGGRPTCSRTNNNCQAAVCDCDRRAAHCFAWAKYNPENKYMDQTRCETFVNQ